jgi:hypothetical protein
MYLGEVELGLWTELTWVKIGTSGGFLQTWYWTFRYHKMLGNSWRAEQLVGSQAWHLHGVGWLFWFGLLDELYDICSSHCSEYEVDLLGSDTIQFGNYVRFRGTCCLHQWGRWQQVHLKCWHQSTKLCGITSQKTVIWKRSKSLLDVTPCHEDKKSQFL